MLVQIISLAALSMFTIQVFAGPVELERRDTMPVKHITSFNCREQGQGDSAVSLCYTEAGYKPVQASGCSALASWFDYTPPFLIATWEPEGGYMQQGDCRIEITHQQDANSSGGLVNVTYSSGLVEDFIKKQAQACFYPGSKFNAFHCSMSDPTLSVMVRSDVAAS